MVLFGLQGSSSLLMCGINQALTVGLDYPGDSIDSGSWPGPTVGPRTVHTRVPEASGPLGRCALVYMDDCLVHSPTLAHWAQHLLDVGEFKVLEIFSRRQL
jgi:hypothetical protein